MSLLSQQSQVNADTAFFAPASGGGGGGGGGPNPAFSTITFPAAVPTPSGPTAGGILFSQQLLLDDPATNIAGDFAFSAAQPYVGAGGATSTTSFAIFAPANESVLTIGAGADQALYIDGSAASGAPALYVRGIAGISVSSMTISSINGVAPGGGGSSGSIAVSTITSIVGQPAPINTITIAPGTNGDVIFSGYPGTAGNDVNIDTGIAANSITSAYQPGGQANAIVVNDVTGGSLNNITIGATSAGGGILAVGKGANGGVSTLTVCSDNVSFLQPTSGGLPLNIQAVDTSLYALSVPGQAQIEIGVVGGRKQMYAPVAQVDDCMISSIVSPGGKGVNLLDPLLVSSIVGVSTINGAAYPPASGSAITRSAVATNTSGDILGDGTLTPISPSFTTTAGHLYSLTGIVYASASPNISSNASLALQIGNIDRAYQSAIPLWGYSAAGGLSFGNNIPVNMTWRANTGAVNNLLQAQMVDGLGTAVSTTITAGNSLMLVDYGFVA